MTADTNRHYSQEVALFEGFLDPYMKYSSGWFESWDEPLDAAILHMLDRIIDAGQVKPGARVLDVGNGWGCVLKRLREVRDDLDYTGVNPSEVQLTYIAQNVDTAGEQHCCRFEDVMGELPGGYDTIFMIGALCHVRDKDAVLQRAHALLADGGRLVLEDTFFLSEALYQKHAARAETRFVQSDVFGFAHVHSLASHFDALRRANLHAVSTLDHSDHYARTIEIWTERLKAMDAERFPLSVQFVQYMDLFQRGWNYTISNHLMAVEKLPPRRRQREAFPR